jgi:hypothetical protein
MARVTRTVTLWGPCAAATASLGAVCWPISSRVTRRPAAETCSPARRSTRESVPAVLASAIFCAPTGSTATVTVATVVGFSARSSAICPAARTRTFWSTTSEKAAPACVWRVSTRSIRSPGRTKPATPEHVVDPNRHGAHPLLEEGRQGAALARTRHLEGHHGLVRLHGREHDALDPGAKEIGDAPEPAGRHGLLGPADLLEVARRQLRAVAQGHRGDHERAQGHRGLRPSHLRGPVLGGLAHEPLVAHEHGRDAEHDGQAQHDQGLEAHEGSSELGSTLATGRVIGGYGSPKLGPR